MKRTIAGIAIVLAAAGACAADLVIGLGADVTSLDPHVLNAAPNNSIAERVMDALAIAAGRAAVKE